MVKPNQINRLQNGTLTIVLTDWYFKLTAPVTSIKTSGVEIKVLLDIKRTPLCLYYYELWKLLEEHFQFRSVYSYVSLDNALKTIFDGKADMFLGPVVLMPWPGNPIQYLGPTTKIWYEISVKQPTLIESSGFYIAVFPLGIWLLYLFILFVFPLLFWMLIQYTNIRKSIRVMKQSYLDYFMTTIGSLCLQGLQKVPKFHFMRMFALVILMYGYLMNISYSALLIARLSVTMPALPFKSLEELGGLLSYQVCVNSGSVGEQYFRDESVEPRYNPPWVNRVNGPDCQHVGGLLVQDTLVNAMCSKKIVSMTISAPPMDFYTGSSSCTILSLKQKFQQFYVNPIVARRLTYAKLIRKRALRLMECGLNSYLYRKQFKRKKSGSFEPKKQHINYFHVSGVFRAYFAAAIGSLFLLIMEMFLFKYKPRKFS